MRDRHGEGGETDRHRHIDTQTNRDLETGTQPLRRAEIQTKRRLDTLETSADG